MDRFVFSFGNQCTNFFCMEIYTAYSCKGGTSLPEFAIRVAVAQATFAPRGRDDKSLFADENDRGG